MLGDAIDEKTFILDIRALLNDSTILNLEMQVIQISFLNFTLFPEHPEFYATYKLLNVNNHTLYSDKLQISVVDLTQIQLATKEDKAHQIDYWATLFTCKDWEELTMLAENNEYLKEATETVYELSQEEQIRMQCEAREDYNRRMLGIGRMLARQTRELKEKDALLAEKDLTIAEKDSALSEQAAIIAALKAQLAAKTT